MTAYNMVIEMDGFSGDRLPGYWGDLKDGGVIGVLVKVSQGTSWTNPHAATVLREAYAAGLLCGALHFMEPDANSANEELAYLLGNLPPTPLALGVVLEIDHLRTANQWEFVAEAQDAVASLRAAGLRPGVRMSV